MFGYRGFILGEDITTVESLREKYLPIAGGDIQRAARGVLAPGNLTVSVTNNKSAVKNAAVNRVLLKCREMLE